MTTYDFGPVRYSSLRWMARSPAHYRYHLDRDHDSPAMRVGRSVDALVLHGRRPRVYEGQRRGKEWERYLADAGGGARDIITVSEYERVSGMAAALRASPEACALLDGDRGGEIMWSYLGRECVSHPDVIAGDCVVDLKTASNAQPDRFVAQARRMAYHAQLAFYSEALAATATRPTSCCLVVVESYPPHPVTILRLTERAVEAGQKLCRLWMEQLLVCEQSGVWPGYCEDVLDYDVEDEPELSYSTGDDPDAGDGTP